MSGPDRPSLADPRSLSAPRSALAPLSWAATVDPETVAGVVFICPFVRDVPMTWSTRRLVQAMSAPASSDRGAPPRGASTTPRSTPRGNPRFRVPKARLVANLHQPGRLAALQAMLRATKSDVESRLDERARADAGRDGHQGPGFRRPRGRGAGDRPASREVRDDRRRRPLPARRGADCTAGMLGLVSGDGRTEGATRRPLTCPAPASPRTPSSTTRRRSPTPMDSTRSRSPGSRCARRPLAVALQARRGAAGRPPRTRGPWPRRSHTRLQRATVGKARDRALFALAHAYWQFARDQPGLYIASRRRRPARRERHRGRGRALLGTVLAVLSGYGVARGMPSTRRAVFAPSSTASSPSTPRGGSASSSTSRSQFGRPLSAFAGDLARAGGANRERSAPSEPHSLSMMSTTRNCAGRRGRQRSHEQRQRCLQ